MVYNTSLIMRFLRLTSTHKKNKQKLTKGTTWFITAGLIDLLSVLTDALWVDLTLLCMPLKSSSGFLSPD